MKCDYCNKEILLTQAIVCTFNKKHYHFKKCWCKVNGKEEREDYTI